MLTALVETYNVSASWVLTGREPMLLDGRAPSAEAMPPVPGGLTEALEAFHASGDPQHLAALARLASERLASDALESLGGPSEPGELHRLVDILERLDVRGVLIARARAYLVSLIDQVTMEQAAIIGRDDGQAETA